MTFEKNGCKVQESTDTIEAFCAPPLEAQKPSLRGAASPCFVCKTLNISVTYWHIVVEVVESSNFLSESRALSMPVALKCGPQRLCHGPWALEGLALALLHLHRFLEDGESTGIWDVPYPKQYPSLPSYLHNGSQSFLEDSEISINSSLCPSSL